MANPNEHQEITTPKQKALFSHAQSDERTPWIRETSERLTQDGGYRLNSYAS
jgi:hypothetical protein